MPDVIAGRLVTRIPARCANTKVLVACISKGAVVKFIHITAANAGEEILDGTNVTLSVKAGVLTETRELGPVPFEFIYTTSGNPIKSQEYSEIVAVSGTTVVINQRYEDVGTTTLVVRVNNLPDEWGTGTLLKVRMSNKTLCVWK